MARKIVVTSGKGGVGKTTVAAAMAESLARRGERVILVDADFGLNSLDVACGVEGRVLYDISDVIEGKCRGKQALIPHPKTPNLHLLTSRRLDFEKYVSAQALKAVLDGLQAEFDYIFVDSPAGIGDGFHRAVAPCEEAIVVTEPHICAIRDADKAVAVLKSYALGGVWVLVNRVRGDLVAGGKQLAPDEIAIVLKTPLLGAIPETDALLLGGKECKAVTLAAEALRTGKVRVQDLTKRYSGLFGSLRRLMRGNV